MTPRLLALLMLAVGTLQAIPALNPKKRADRLGDQRVPLQTRDIQRAEGFTSERFEITEWDKRFSTLGSRRANLGFDKDDKKAADMPRYRLPDLREFEVREPRLANLDGKEAQLDNFGRMKEKNLVEKFRGEPILVLDLQAEAMTEAVNDLSLQDINRYQFRRNRSSESGLPVQPAGSGDEAPDRRLDPRQIDPAESDAPRLRPREGGATPTGGLRIQRNR